MDLPNLIYRTKDLAERLIKRKIVVSSRPSFITFHKRFLSVRMDITNRCNLKCIICPRSVEKTTGGQNFDMEWKLFSKIAKDVFPKASELFLSCGSEPLMAKQFSSVLNVVGKAKIPFVSFTTNGLLFNEDIAHKVINSDIKEIEISFDGATESTFAKIRGGSSIHGVIEKVQLLNNLKKSLSTNSPEIVFHITLMLSNIEEISNIIEIAHNLEVSCVRALHLYPHAILDIDGESLYNHKELYDKGIMAAHKRADELGIAFSAPPLFEGTRSRGRSTISGNSQDRFCVYPWTMVRISPEGNVFPCATWLEAKPFGNLNEQRFFDIWYGRQYRQLREEIRSNRLPRACKQCPTATLFFSIPQLTL